MRARRLLFGLATVLGIAERGFFIPYRYAATLPRGPGRVRYPAIEALLARSQDDFRSVLAAIGAHGEDLRAIGDGPPPAPRWAQDWFPRLDAAAAYALVRSLKPRRIVEVGSGHSTRFLARAVADGGLETRITAIDPAPRASLAGLDVSCLGTTAQEAGDAPFAGLAAGDVLFIDSSHILMPGSDVDWLVNHVLPALPVGIYLHMHDVFLPDDYPADWAWRGYNEQLCVAALIHGGGYRPRFASHYVVTRMAGAFGESAVAGLPLAPGARQSSLWLEKL